MVSGKEERVDAHIDGLKMSRKGGGSDEFPKVWCLFIGPNVWVACSDGDIAADHEKCTMEDPVLMMRIGSTSLQTSNMWWYGNTPRSKEHKVNLVESSPDKNQLQLEAKDHSVSQSWRRCERSTDRGCFNLNHNLEVPTDTLLFENPYDIINIGWSKDTCFKNISLSSTSEVISACGLSE